MEPTTAGSFSQAPGVVEQPPTLERVVTIALFNDTGGCAHVKCRAVSDAHARMLARLGVRVPYRHESGRWVNLWQGDLPNSIRAFHRSTLPEQLSGLDAVVVNGEGTIHHGHGLDLLTILAGAQQMGLRTFLVNAVFQQCELFLDTLRHLDDLTVRDARSSAYLARLGIPHRLVFDSSLEAGFDSQPVHDFADRVVITDWHPARAGDVGNLLEALRASLGPGAVYYPLEDPARAADWRHAVADLQAARLVVTGRHHGVCLAAMAGVPFVALGSNTWKIEGLLEVLPGQLRVCERACDLIAACHQAIERRALFQEIRQFLQAQRPLPTFDPLVGCGISSRLASDTAEGFLAEAGLAEHLAEAVGSRQVLVLEWLSDTSVRISTYPAWTSCWRLLHTARRQPHLPFASAAWETVALTGGLDRLTAAALPGWLREVHRVTRRHLWVSLQALSKRPSAWWIQQWEQAGFHSLKTTDGLGRLGAGGPPLTDGLILEKSQSAAARVGLISRPSSARTICLATNYLLMTPSTRQMWADLAQELERLGCQLILLSTTLPDSPLPCPVYLHPYLMRDFAVAFPALAERGELSASAWELARLRADQSRAPVGYSLDQALRGLTAFRAYATELLQRLQPGFVLLADNTLCQTALLHRLCRETDVPVAIYERGLLPETLMLESYGMQAWSDLRTHWLARQMPALDAARYAAIRDYYLRRKPQKYHQPDFGLGGAALREQLGLTGKQVVAFLGGGYEANGHAAPGSNYERLFFTGFPTTESALMGLWRLIEKQPGTALVFKPHPLDSQPYTVAEIEGVQLVRDVNVHALIEAADVVAAQFTTLQFEAALYDKPVLLLARSAWWGRGAAYEVDSPEALSAQLEAALQRRDWPRHQTNAQAFLTWIMDQFLIGCTPEVPTRAHLGDLAQFIVRNALESRDLPPTLQRWDQTLAWLEAHRGQTQL
jgi:hypothetical protein